MRTPYETPDAVCPYCGHRARCEYVDIGVGMQQVTPFVCDNCQAYQIGPYDKPVPLTDEEKRTGWYAPDEAAR